MRRTALHAALPTRRPTRDRGASTTACGRLGDATAGRGRPGCRARYLVAADGLHSSVRAWPGSTAAAPRAPARAVRGPHGTTPSRRGRTSSRCTGSATGEAYVTPVGDEVVGVAVLARRRRRGSTTAREFPELRRRLDGCAAGRSGPGSRAAASARPAPDGGAGAAGRGLGRLRRRTDRRGHPVGLASARAAVAAIAAGTPTAYEGSWRAATRRYRWLTEALLWSRQHRVTAPLIVPAAQRVPRLMGTLVNQLAR